MAVEPLDDRSFVGYRRKLIEQIRGRGIGRSGDPSASSIAFPGTFLFPRACGPGLTKMQRSRSDTARRRPNPRFRPFTSRSSK